MLLNGFSFEKFQYFPNMSSNDSYQTEVSDIAIHWRHYDDLRAEHYETFTFGSEAVEKSKIYFLSLEHFENEDDYLKFFLEYRDRDNKALSGKIQEIPAFRKSGMRHSFMRNSIVDSSLHEISILELSEFRAVRKIVEQRKLNSRDSTFLTKYQNNKPEELEGLRNEITKRYKKERKEFMAIKLEKIKKEMMDLYDLKIDGQSIKDDLNCRFYIHNNLHEKGLLCYTPIDSLSFGEHTFEMNKVNGKLNKEIEVPFRRVKAK